MYSYDICSNIIKTDFKKAHELCQEHLQRLTFFDICYIMEMLVHKGDDVFLKFIHLFDSSRHDVLKIVKEKFQYSTLYNVEYLWILVLRYRSPDVIIELINKKYLCLNYNMVTTLLEDVKYKRVFEYHMIDIEINSVLNRIYSILTFESDLCLCLYNYHLDLIGKLLDKYEFEDKKKYEYFNAVLSLFSIIHKVNQQTFLVFFTLLMSKPRKELELELELLIYILKNINLCTEKNEVLKICYQIEIGKSLIDKLDMHTLNVIKAMLSSLTPISIDEIHFLIHLIKTYMLNNHKIYIFNSLLKDKLVNILAIELLLESDFYLYTKDLNQCHVSSRSILHICAFKSSFEINQKLLSIPGINKNIIYDVTGTTPIHESIHYNTSLDVFRLYYMDNEIDVTITDKSNHESFLRSLLMMNDPIIDYIVNHSRQETISHLQKTMSELHFHYIHNYFRRINDVSMDKIEIIFSKSFFYEIFRGVCHLFKHVVESGSCNIVLFLLITDTSLFTYIEDNLNIFLKIIDVCDTQILKYILDHISISEVALHNCLVQSSFTMNIDNFIYLYLYSYLHSHEIDLGTLCRCIGLILRKKKVNQITKLLPIINDELIDLIIQHDLRITTSFFLLYNKTPEIDEFILNRMIPKIPTKVQLYLWCLYDSLVRYIMPIDLIQRLLYIIRPSYNDLYSIYKHQRLRYFNYRDLWDQHLLLLIDYGVDILKYKIELVYEDSENREMIENRYKKQRILNYTSTSTSELLVINICNLPKDLLREVLQFLC